MNTRQELTPVEISLKVSVGKYLPVGILVPTGGGGQLEKIWWNPETRGQVRERGDCRGPFSMVVTDFDGTLVDTEGINGFFAVCWRALFREAGIEGSDDALEALRRKSYSWEGTLPASVRGMIERIQSGVDRNGVQLDVSEQTALARLIEPDRLRRWARINEKDDGSDVLTQAPDIIADRKEQIGADLLASNPSLVRQLAPFTPGSVKFMRAIPPDVLVGIASGSRVKTTILPILQAHAYLGEGFILDRVGPLIVGEDNLIGRARKPDRRFYEHAIITMARMLHEAGRIPKDGILARDILYIGDRIARTADIDAPLTRKGVSHLVINAGNVARDPGPFIALAPDFLALMGQLRKPHNDIQNPIVARLANTLNLQ